MTDNEENELISLFLNEKPVKMLVRLRRLDGRSYSAELSRKLGFTYSHAVRIGQRLEDLGLVSRVREGRRAYLDLTSDGEQIAESFEQVLGDLE